MDARTLRERRKQRIAARAALASKRVTAQDDDNDMPEWLEEKIEETSEEGTDVGEPGPAEGQDEEAAEEEEEEGMEELGEDIEELAEDLEELKEDEAAEEEIEEEKATESMSLGAFNYNPVYQKPTHLGSGKPSGGYHYFGPPPDAGTTYGYYTEASGLRLIAPLAKSVFSPLSGKRMKFEGKVDIDGLASVLAMVDRMTSLTLASGEERMTSAPLMDVETPQLFDALTGKDISDDVANMRAENDEPVIEEEDAVGQDEDTVEEPPAEMTEEEALEQADQLLSQMGEEDEEAMGQEDVDMPADLGQGLDEMPAQNEDEPELEEEEEEAQLEEEEEPAEAVEYEALQQMEDLEEPLTEADVHMTLFDDQDEQGRALANPYWNVDIRGMPVARIYLADQPKPEEIREMFVSSDYHRGIAGAVEKVGLAPVFKQVKAHLWANKVYETKLAKQIRAQVEGAANRRVTSTTRNLMKSLLERIAVVCAGMDKNFYREEGNPLKEALWAEMHSFGITNPTSIIEAGFRRGSTKYFETVLGKAVEYMEMEPKALVQVKKAIGEMDVLTPGDQGKADELPDATPTTPDEMPTLSQRLAASSVAIGHIPAVVGDAFGEHKRALREQLRLGGAGPRIKR